MKAGYALVLSDLALAPLTPSSGARAGAIMCPIVRGISTAMGSEPGETSRKAGACLIQAVYQCEGILCAMFMTAMAGNVPVVDLAKKTAGADITWGTWALAACVPGAICLLLHPWLMLKLFPPEIKKFPEAKAHAVQKLEEMGSMSKYEITLGITFLVALFLWRTSSLNNLNAATVAMAAVSFQLWPWASRPTSVWPSPITAVRPAPCFSAPAPCGGRRLVSGRTFFCTANKECNRPAFPDNTGECGPVSLYIVR